MIFSLYLAVLVSGQNVASFAPAIAAGAMALAYLWLTPVTFVTGLVRFAASQLLFAVIVIGCVSGVRAVDALPNAGSELIGALASGGLLYVLTKLPAWLWLER